MRRLLFAVAAVAVLVALDPLWNLVTNDAEIPKRWMPWITVLTVLLTVVAVIIGMKGSSPAPPPADLLAAADRLALEVRNQWRTERERQQLLDPLPLPVRWRTAPESLTDHWANIRDIPPGSTAEPLELEGRLDQIADVYRKIDSGRLVILGRAGSGKTILAMWLLLDLLKERTTGQPVPVSFSLGSWDPAVPLRGWLVEQLIRDHPQLDAPGPHGGNLATALVSGDHILPILDGFDEMAEGLHRPALEILNTIELPLVLTSRRPEYAAAVRGTHVLTRAAAVELVDLTTEDLANYLPRTTVRRTSSGGATTEAAWDRVLGAWRAHPPDPAGANLAAVLRTPLMVTLARTIYSRDPERHPNELLDTDRLSTPEAIEDHLLGNFLPAVYREVPGHRQRWQAKPARRWLRHLAQHLHRRDPDRPESGDLAWWELGDSLRRSSRMLVTGVTAGLVAGLVDWLAYGLVYGLLFGPGHGIEALRGIGLADGLLAGLAASLAFGLGYGLLTILRGGAFEPSRVRVQLPGRTRAAWQRIGSRARVGFLGGLAYGIVAGTLSGSVMKPALGVVYGGPAEWLGAALVFATLSGAVYGSALGLLGGLMAWFEAPLHIASAMSPAALLRTNRRNVLVQLLVFGPLFGLMASLGTWLGINLLPGDVGPVVYRLHGGLITGLAVAFGGGLGAVLTVTAWGQWIVLARIWLPLTGRLPFAVLAFLDDAHRRGVLRQAGAVYQFRHSRLQDHLADGG